MRRAAALVGIATLSAACGSQGPPEIRPVPIRFSLDVASCGWIPCDTPDTCPLDCGGEIGVYAVDPETGEEIERRCVGFVPDANDKLRKLTSHLDGTTLELAEGTRVVIEVAVFAGYQGCPRVLGFRPDGVAADAGVDPGTMDPPETFPLYFGQSTEYTLAGDEVIIDVPLQCTSSAFCPNQTSKIRANVTDLVTLGDTPYEVNTTLAVQAANLTHYDPDMMDPWTARMEPFASLQLVSDVAPTFEVSSEQGFFFTDCGGTLVTRVAAGDTFSTGSCQYFFGGPTGLDVEAQSYYIGRTDMDLILAALGLSDIPTKGLLVGRFTDQGQPTDDYLLRPTNPTSTLAITYLERDDGDGSFFVRPQGGSWFVVTDATVFDWSSGLPATCCEYLAAEDVARNLSACSTTSLGLVEGVVMATVIEIPSIRPLSCP